MNHHDHHKHHHHHRHDDDNTGKLIITIVLNFVIAIVEVLGGLASRSLSLLSDSLHNFSDAVAVLISLIAYKLSKKEITLTRTFGYKRAEILAALFNALVLIIISFFLFKEAVVRFGTPEIIDARIMIVVAALGLVANAIAVLLLKKGSEKNINIKSAYLHLFSDALSSLTVVAGAALIYFFKMYWIDPVFTVLIGLYVLKGSFSILMEAVSIIMHAVPEHLDILEVQREVEKIAGVCNLHHVHVWRLNDADIHFEGHLVLDSSRNIDELGNIYHEVQGVLLEKFGINHVTMQAESQAFCNGSDLIGCRK